MRRAIAIPTIQGVRRNSVCSHSVGLAAVLAAASLFHEQHECELTGFAINAPTNSLAAL